MIYRISQLRRIIEVQGDSMMEQACYKPEGGLASWLQPKKEPDLIKLSTVLLEKGVQIIPPENFSFKEPVNGISFRL